MIGDLVAELDDDRAQIEDDLASLGADELALVLEQQHELAVRPRHDLDPGGLGARALQDPLRSLVGGLAGEAGEGRGEPALGLREALGDHLLDVDVGIQLLDGDQRHLLADRVVADQIRRDPLHAALVEDGSLDGEGEHPDEGDEHREDREDASSDQPRATYPRSGLRVHKTRRGIETWGH